MIRLSIFNTVFSSYMDLISSLYLQDSAAILVEHEKLKQENCALLAAMGNNEEK